MTEARPTRSAPATDFAFRFVDTQAELAALCDRWQRHEAVGLDTEFVRTRTFYPQLGLVQVADLEGAYLLDPLALQDLGPLVGLLRNRGVVKVLHSASEDLEIFYHLCGHFPRSLFDTQIAATLAGHGSSLGYQNLVQTLLGQEVPKEETRSNWLRRPLTTSQKAYAVRDVAYLLPAYDLLRRELAALGRQEWVREEVQRLEDGCRFNLDPEKAYLRIRRAANLKPRQLALLQALSRWREREARRRDLPRNFVLQEKVLLQLVERPPQHLEELAQFSALSAGERKRSGATLLRLIRQAQALPVTELASPPPPRPIPSVRRKRLLKEMRRRVERRAEALDLPPEFLVQRRVLTQLLRNLEAASQQPLPPELAGWRRQIVGDELLELARSVLTRSSPPPG